MASRLEPWAAVEARLAVILLSGFVVTRIECGHEGFGARLQGELSRYLKDARAGRDVVVMSRGRPIVRLLAVAEEIGEEPGGKELLRRLKLVPGLRLGAGGEPLGTRRPIRIRPGQRTLAQIVLEDRR